MPSPRWLGSGRPMRRRAS